MYASSMLPGSERLRSSFYCYASNLVYYASNCMYVSMIPACVRVHVYTCACGLCTYSHPPVEPQHERIILRRLLGLHIDIEERTSCCFVHRDIPVRCTMLAVVVVPGALNLRMCMSSMKGLKPSQCVHARVHALALELSKSLNSTF